MLSSVELQNWRCAESLVVPLEPLTALVGPNGAGKTAVLDAINLVLGARWPGMSSVDIPRDFYAHDTSRDLRITCSFDPPLTHEDVKQDVHQIVSLEFRCQPYRRKTKKAEAGDLHEDFSPLADTGERPMVVTKWPKGAAPVFEPLRVSAMLRDQSRALMIGDRRSVSVHGTGRRGSVLASLLDVARRDYRRDSSGSRTAFEEGYEKALDALRTEGVQEIEAAIGETAKQMLGFLGRRAVGELEIAFGFADPGNPFSSLTVMCKEGDLVLPAESMGLGIQSAIVVGIFEALRRQQANVGTVLIEEPEMYLHPQAQRFFYRLLREMVEDGRCQVIYTTHSPIFADMTRFRSVRLLQRPAGGATTASWIRNKGDEEYLQGQLDRRKLDQYMDPAASEALFARRVLLVEGHGDRLAAELVARGLGLDLDGEGLSVVACGGKAAIPFFARMCRSLGIACLVLHDEDIYAADDAPLARWQIDENEKAPQQNADIEDAVGDAGAVFKATPTLEAALGIGRGASDKPAKVVEQLTPQDIDEMPATLVAAVRALGAEPDAAPANGMNHEGAGG